MYHNTLYAFILRGNKLAAKELIKRCKEKGYSLNPKIGHVEITLFQLIVRKNLTDIAIYFMKHGVKINTQDKFGNTPLHEAAKNGNKILIEQLLKKGANPFIRNAQGMTAWMLTEHNNNLELAFRLHPSFILKYPNLFFSSDHPPKEVKTQDTPLNLSPDRPLDLTTHSYFKK